MVWYLFILLVVSPGEVQVQALQAQSAAQCESMRERLTEALPQATTACEQHKRKDA